MLVWYSKGFEFSDLENFIICSYDFYLFKIYLVMIDEGVYFVWEDWIGVIGDENIRFNDGVVVV